MTRALALACLLLSSCSNGSEPDGADVLTSDAPVPIEQFARAMAAAACNAADVCEPDAYIRTLVTDGTCVEALERMIGLRFAHATAAVRAGRGSYDGAAVRACLESFEGLCPSSFRLLVNTIRPDAWCPEAFVGCEFPPKEPWSPPVLEGAYCEHFQVPCAKGLGCSYESNTCEPCAEVGDAALDDCIAAPDAVEGLADIYLVDRPRGASCDHPDYRPVCNVGLECDFETLTCVPAVAPLSTCGGP